MIFLVILFGWSTSFGIAKIEGLDIISQENRSIEFSKNQKGTVVIFLSPLCPCSEAHTDTIKALIKEFKDFKFVGVYSSPEDNEEFREYFKMKDFGIPVIRDSKYVYADELHASNTPHAFVVNVKGEVLYKGGVTSSSKAKKDSEQYLKNALNQILQKKEVKPSETRVLGCSIRDT